MSSRSFSFTVFMQTPFVVLSANFKLALVWLQGKKGFNCQGSWGDLV